MTYYYSIIVIILLCFLLDPSTYFYSQELC